jgi:hypothetical protein
MTAIPKTPTVITATNFSLAHAMIFRVPFTRAVVEIVAVAPFDKAAVAAKEASFVGAA